MRVHIYKVTPTDSNYQPLGVAPFFVHTVLEGEAGIDACESYVVTRGWARQCEAEYDRKSNEDVHMVVDKAGRMQVITGYHGGR